MNSTQAWVKMLRLSNMPTLISNAVVGLGLGMVAHNHQWENRIIIPRFVALKIACIITFALLCAYFAGFVLNDAVDATLDRKHRLDRPIPKGIISKRNAWITGISLLASALFISMLTQERAAIFMLLLIGCILAYTFLHRWLLCALVFMGACRGMVYVVAVSSFDVALQWQPLLTFSLGIAWYTAMLTLIARSEHMSKASNKWLVLLLLPAAFVPAFFYCTPLQLMLVIGALSVFTIWTAFAFFQFATCTARVHGIHSLLAGFCILDCVYLSILGEVNLAIISGFCFVFTVAAQRKILGT